MSKVYEYFCGLHFLVGLADQAEASCKIWDTLCPNAKVRVACFADLSNHLK